MILYVINYNKAVNYSTVKLIFKSYSFINDFLLKWGRYGFDRGSSSLGGESRGSASLKRQSL